MVDIEHKQPIEVTVSEPSVTEHPAFCSLRCVKLIATENECHKVVLQLLSKSQQTLFVALLKELLTRTELFKSTLLGQKLTIVLILQPLARDLRIVLLHSLQNLPSAVNLPGSRGVPHAVPELLSAAPDSLREVSVFLITESLIHNSSLNTPLYHPVAGTGAQSMRLPP